MKGRKLLFCSLLLLWLPVLAGAKTLKVLAIGNSFSQDAVEQYLFELAKAQGDSLIIGNAYIGGCSIERHYTNLRRDSALYVYRKVIGGVRAVYNKQTLRRIIQDESWDLITFQQSSKLSGIPDTYTLLPSLIQQVRIHATKLNVQFAWHMTWAYAWDFKSKNFEPYGYNQRTMYSSIVSAMLSVLPSVNIKDIIPSGIAIQLARYHFGDVLNRDGFHLSYTLGRYIAACTWCEFLTGKDIEGNPYHPDSINEEDAFMCQQAAHSANFMQKIGKYAVF